MTYFLWSSPALAVILLIASGRVGTVMASISGVVIALAVAVTTAPAGFNASDAMTAAGRGAWIGWIVVPYILGGLLFWQMAMRTGNAQMPVENAAPGDDRARRRLLFTACFLIGPFAESATGFGVGIIGTFVLVRRLGLAPSYLLSFSLLSQTMILWGGMGSGAIVGAAFARTDAISLAFHGSFIMLAFNLLWLPLYWRLAERAGVPANWPERLSEAGWLIGSVLLVSTCTALLGPETAMLAAYGPVIVARYLADERPGVGELIAAARRMMPFTLLISWLVITRVVPSLQQGLQALGRVEPFAGTPSWSPFFHAGTWLVVAAFGTAVLRGHISDIAEEAKAAWKTGRLAVLSIIIFSIMAEIISSSGIAGGLASGLYDVFGRWAVVLTPQISAIFGALANSGNAANGLFMGSQVNLAESAGLNIAAVIALQHVAALSLNMISPVRMSIVCGLAGTPGKEREAYRVMAPFACVMILILLAISFAIALNVI
ncbi:L-lactate permease [Mesorhizobium sp. SB112]|uniref:L-lactate permease n=1 Tax=Mesorhizobium sp. SB112 TaxID=3151853 RepID=UPI003266C7D5